MLLELNRKQGLLPLAEVKTYYAKAALEYPPSYGNYSFDEWMAFMKSNGLVLRHPSDMVEITLRGKDFLRYLVPLGTIPRSADFMKSAKVKAPHRSIRGLGLRG